MSAQGSEQIARLRILVLTLGEASHAGWWRSQFLSPIGLSFLTRLYPRSYFAAAVRSATRAAKAVHDSSIGVGDAFHLFRLPQHMEQAVDEFLQEHEAQLSAEFVPLLTDREKLLDRLQALGDAKTTPKAVGPLRLGTQRDLSTPTWFGATASSYWTAIRDGVRVFPYYVESEK